MFLPLLVMMASTPIAVVADQWSVHQGPTAGSETLAGATTEGTANTDNQATRQTVIYLDTTTDEATVKTPVILTTPDQGSTQNTNLRRTFLFGFVILVLLALCLVFVFSFTY